MKESFEHDPKKNKKSLGRTIHEARLKHAIEEAQKKLKEDST